MTSGCVLSYAILCGGGVSPHAWQQVLAPVFLFSSSELAPIAYLAMNFYSNCSTVCILSKINVIHKVLVCQESISWYVLYG